MDHQSPSFPFFSSTSCSGLRAPTLMELEQTQQRLQPLPFSPFSLGPFDPEWLNELPFSVLPSSLSPTLACTPPGEPILIVTGDYACDTGDLGHCLHL